MEKRMENAQKNIAVLEETLAIFEKGSYRAGGKKVRLRTTAEERSACTVLLPGEARQICGGTAAKTGGCALRCVNTDSFAMARQLRAEGKDGLLVLNFANPVNIGGGVRRGARAQEEDLCRKSSLLLSLESEAAMPYYRCNRSLHTYMGSDAMIFSPQVEVIRDENGDLLPEPFTVAVQTCAAPYIGKGPEGMTREQYVLMLRCRIDAMLCCAAREGYAHLVLGAWGCGAFGNDAALIATLFDASLKSFGGYFQSVSFAVLDRSQEQYNFKAFARCFGTP